MKNLLFILLGTLIASCSNKTDHWYEERFKEVSDSLRKEYPTFYFHDEEIGLVIEGWSIEQKNFLIPTELGDTCQSVDLGNLQTFKIYLFITLEDGDNNEEYPVIFQSLNSSFKNSYVELWMGKNKHDCNVIFARKLKEDFDQFLYRIYRKD